MVLPLLRMMPKKRACFTGDRSSTAAAVVVVVVDEEGRDEILAGAFIKHASCALFPLARQRVKETAALVHL